MPKVYLTSTYADLKKQRLAVQEVLENMGFDIVTIDNYGKPEDSPIQSSQNALKDSDIVVLLIAYNYGYIPPSEKKSIIELEYETAIKLDKPIFIFIVDENMPWPVKLIQTGHEAKYLESFKYKIKRNHLVTYFKTPDDLKTKVASAIESYSLSKYIPPETEKGKKTTIDDILHEIRTLKSQMDFLTEFVTQSRNLNRNIKTEKENLNNRPAEFLGPLEDPVYSQCFIIMPYSESWSEAVEKIIREICGKVGLKFVIAKNMDGRFIPQDIFRGITGSGIIIADLSGANPNVTYEVGLADVLGRNVILLSQQEKIPFDFYGQRLILYENTVSGALKLRETLNETLLQYMEHHVKIKKEIQ